MFTTPTQLLLLATSTSLNSAIVFERTVTRRPQTVSETVDLLSSQTLPAAMFMTRIRNIFMIKTALLRGELARLNWDVRT
jgi:hypothetical protein